LERRLARLAEDYAAESGIDVTELPGAGAAGGLAGGLATLGAELVVGFDVVAERLDLEDRVEGAQLVVTGEGFLDAQSFDGKVVGGVVELAGDAGVPVLVIVGERDDGLRVPEGVAVVSLVEAVGRDRAMGDTVGAVEELVRDYLR